MIRDQFQDVKKATSKETRKKATMGERNYYAKQISKLQDMNKSLGVSMIITSIIMGIAYVFIALVFWVTMGTEEAYELWRFLVWTVVFAICLGFTIVFYVVIKPSNKKKIERYRHELERISAQALSKAAGTYALYGDKFKQEQVKKHAEEKEKALKQAEEKSSAESSKTQDEGQDLEQKDDALQDKEQ
ncbi:MAG: hypothetical protein IJW64_07015 [Clostridia bacterium]|nr:hypothetical protein [Clostridia bacterium]